MILEDLDAHVDDGVFFVSSFGFGVIEGSLLLKVSNLSLKSEDGLLPDGVSLSL